MIPLAWAKSCEAPPGTLLVERDEMPVQARGLWLPEGYRKHTLSGTARIVSVSDLVIYQNSHLWFDPKQLHKRLMPGAYVLLTASAGKPIVFGIGGTTRTLARITPAQILAVLHSHAETKAEHAPPLALDADILNYGQTFDAGDPKALR